MRVIFFLFAGLLSLTACANSPWREPSTDTANYAPPPAANIQPGEQVQVQPGDTVYAISKRYKVTISDIIALNNLHSPFILAPGSMLTIPGKTMVTVSSKMLPHAAPIKEAAIPVKEATGAPMAIVPDQMPAPQKAPVVPVQSTTLYHQEPTYQQRVDSGEKEVVQYQHSTREVMATLSKETVQPPVNVQPLPASKPVAAPLPPPSRPQLAAAMPSQSGLVERIKPMAVAPQEARFVWPVHGSTVSGFGPKPGGTRNDGINIAAPLGAPVAAADGGTVAYAGNDIPGYGNVVIIRHPDGYLTTYAHLERIMVDKDSITARGDVIGTVGTSGGLASPQLHFEVRKGAEALDPAKFLSHG